MADTELDLEAKVARYARIVCPTHGIPDCSVLLNGCNVPNYLTRAGEDVRALVAEVRRLRGLLPAPPPPGVVIVSWSGKRHLALTGGRVLNDGSRRARCSAYTYGTEPDAGGDVVRGVKQGKRAEHLPMCKSCTRGVVF